MSVTAAHEEAVQEKLGMGSRPEESTDDSDTDLPELYDATSDSGSGSPTVKEPELQKPEPAEAQEILRRYAAKFGESRDGEAQGFNRRAFPWYSGESYNEKGEVAMEELEAALKKRAQKAKRQAKLWDVDSEGEQVTLCAHCLLPVGEVSYSGQQGKSTPLHGECAAQLMLQEMKEKDVKRVQDEAEKKRENRSEHGIGWTVQQVPKNTLTAAKLGCSPPQGLCCLVWDEAARSLRLAATAEPAAAVNLEYLLLALKVRYHACREPLFSLDPVNPENLEKTMLEKRFTPSWLAGTSIGELMFQADYYLKELSMGEHDMPMMGMMSVFDWSEADNVKGGWTGREWFVVNQAEVRLAGDNTLVPHVKMGVEARTQVVGAKGLQDTPITSKNHPLRKFADNFTKHFDLIAERQSVIFHLRELAKASVMAKFIVDSGTTVPPEWWRLADELVSAASAKTTAKQIPQLWNMRGQSRIQVRDGKMLNSATGQWSYLTSIYGGIEFQLDRFELAQRHTLRPVGPGASTMVGGLQGMQLGPSAGRPGFAPARFQLTQRAPAPAPAAEQPQGVDLNLDSFDLTNPDRFRFSVASCSASEDSLEARVPLGQAFLDGVRQAAASAFKPEDRHFLRNLYKDQLTDRTQEGDAFVPPDPDMKYVNKIRALVSEEEILRGKRVSLFSDAAFIPENPGPAFPRSWTSNFQVEHQGMSTGLVKKALRSGMVQLALNPTFKKLITTEMLPSTAPVFEKSSEDGACFRIYRIGSLEIRTVQEPESPEIVKVVFSFRGTKWTALPGKAQVADSEKIVRARMFVEAVDTVGDLARSIHGKAAEPTQLLDAPWRSQKLDHCHYFMVLETDKENMLVTEKCLDGTVSLVVNPENAEDRMSLARLLYTHDNKEGSASVREVKVFQASSAKQTPDGATASDNKLYARNLYKLASGKAWLVRKAKGAGKGRKPVAGSESVPPAAVPSSERRTYSSKGLLAYANYAKQSMKGVAERAGGAVGGHVGFAMQAATISTQAWVSFFVLLALGSLLMAASFASLPMLVLAPQKFATVFTTGSACILGALCSLKGVQSFFAHLTSRERLPLSVGYLGSMVGTIWASMWYRSTVLTMAFSVAQISGLLWFFVSYIPGGSYSMGLVCDFLKGAVRHVCCGQCANKGSLPL
ncbi:sft2 [Symbiodinium necroappetens]|uniref:Vesicle transport protein n=1 Tax=Symbiodinium necroappetens TaxID=1628268 RepID=A0A812SV16_9DINO|nr:sft2 [Symbiodinium necroappetens]